jgi:uncharacterized protein YjdB
MRPLIRPIVRLAAFASALATSLVSCGGADSSSGPPVVGQPQTAVATVSVSAPSTTLQIGQTLQLSATVRDASGATLPGRMVAWSTSSEALATVSSSGLVVGQSAGAATITATSEGKAGSVTLTVTPVPVATVTVTPDDATVSVGASRQLTAAAKDAAGNVLSGRTVAWTSSAASVAAVSATGLVTGVAGGSATITATIEGKQGTARVTVSPTSLSLRPSMLTKFVGDTVRLRAFDGTRDVSASVTWATASTGVASIDAQGLVRANAVGATTLTATLGTSVASVPLTVTPEPTSPADINAHFPFAASAGALTVYSDISPEFSQEHVQHLDKVWKYFSSVFARSPGSYTTMYYTDDLYGLYQRIFAYCPSVVIPGARNTTTCYDWTDRVYIWYVVPYIKPDFGTQLHEISHTFVYATYAGAETNVWFKEGTGMYFESGAFDDAGRLRITTPLPYIRDNFARWRQQNALIPLQQLVTMTRDQFYGYPEPTKTYSQAGMFIFYLVTQQANTWAELLQRLNDQTITTNTQLLDFITTSTGLSTAQLETAYLQYALQF